MIQRISNAQAELLGLEKSGLQWKIPSRFVFPCALEWSRRK